MASTYTDIGTELMTTGENAGNWGTKTNVNLQILEEAIRGYVAISANSDQTLSLTDGSTGDSIRNSVIAFTGTLSANRTITVPALEKWWIMDNQTAGAYTLTVKVSGQTGITWGASDKGTKILYGNGTDVVDTNIGGGVGAYDLNGNTLTLDADGDTDITSDTDDQIDIRIAGADDFQFTANTFTAQAGSTIAAQALTATTVTASGIVKTDDTTEATSTTDGSLQTDGGLSVAKDAVLGDDLKLLSDSAVLSFGADSDTTLTHTDGTGLTLNSTNKLLFRDTGLYINSSTDGQLDLVADTEIQIAATTIDINGAIAMDGAITGATNITLSGELDAATLDISGNADIDGTTNLDAVDIDGAVQVDATITVGADDQGYDVKFFGDTASAYMLWDTSTDDLVLAGAAGIDLAGDIDVDGTANLDAVDIDGAVQVDNTITVGADDQGYDVKFFGDTASAYMLWDTSADDLILGGAARIVVPDSGLVLSSTAVTATAAEINLIDGGASTGTTAVADADGIITNDGGTMRLTTAATFKTYFQSGVTASSIAADDIAAGDAAVTIGNGSTSADVTIDSGDDVVIDAAGGNIEFKDAGTTQLTLDMDGTAGAQVISLAVDSDDLIFKQYDGTTVLTLDDDTTVKVATDLTVGDDLTLLSDSAVLGFGADTDTTLTHTDGTGLTLNSTNKLCFNDASQFVQGSSGTVLSLGATDEIDLTATAIDINGTCDISGTFSLAGTNITSTAAEINKLDGVGTLAEAGKQTIWVPANAMTPTASNPCADIAAVETTSGRPDMYVLDFDKDSDEHAQFTVAFPKQWNLGTVTFQVFWSGTANTGGVSWGLQGVACGDNDTIDVAYGTGVVVDDAEQGAVEEVNVSAESGAVTIAGSPADDQLCYFRVYRDVSDSNDDSSGDARLHGIKVFYTTDAANDA
jgi:cytoskeletal protein CcmA (bactofilin family)